MPVTSASFDSPHFTLTELAPGDSALAGQQPLPGDHLCGNALFPPETAAITSAGGALDLLAG